MKKTALILSFVFLLSGCGATSNNTMTKENATKNPNQEQNQEQEQAQNQEQTQISENGEIVVSNINPDDNITSPVVIEGEGVAFENSLVVELRNKNHETLVKEPATIKSSDVGVKGPFSIKLNFVFNNTKEGFVAVYEESAVDSSEVNLVEIPVRFNADEE